MLISKRLSREFDPHINFDDALNTGEYLAYLLNLLRAHLPTEESFSDFSAIKNLDQLCNLVFGFKPQLEQEEKVGNDHLINPEIWANLYFSLLKFLQPDLLREIQDTQKLVNGTILQSPENYRPILIKTIKTESKNRAAYFFFKIGIYSDPDIDKYLSSISEKDAYEWLNLLSGYLDPKKVVAYVYSYITDDRATITYQLGEALLTTQHNANFANLTNSTLLQQLSLRFQNQSTNINPEKLLGLLLVLIDNKFELFDLYQNYFKHFSTGYSFDSKKLEQKFKLSKSPQSLLLDWINSKLSVDHSRIQLYQQAYNHFLKMLK